MLPQRRFRPPPGPERLLTRDRLWNRIAFDPRPSTWLIAAQAGFGKTTLLSTVRQAALARGDVAVWLSPEEQDDPLPFLAGLSQSLTSTGAILEATSSLEGLLRQLEGLAAETPVWILLDDLHRLPTETLHSTFIRMVEQAPLNCRLVAGARTLEGLPLAKVRATGLLQVLDANDLRFSASDIAELGRLGPGPQVQEIVALSGGWPIAACALISDQGLSQGWSSRENAPLLDYVEEEVLTALSTEQQDILARCSLIEQVSAEDVAELIDDRDGHMALASGLRRLGGLVERAEGPGGPYRLNPAVAACLRQRLFSTPGPAAEAAIERAALRLAGTRRIAEAANLARQAHHRELLHRVLLDQTAVDVWLSGMEEMSRLLALADEDMRLSEPRLLLMSMILDMKFGQIGEAEAKMARATERWPPSQPSEQLDLLRMGLVVYGCKIFDAAEEARLTHLLEADGPYARWRMFTQSAACVLYAQQGALDVATSMAVAAMHSLDPDKLPYGILFLNYHLSAIAAAAGETKRARDLLRNGRLILRSRFGRDEGAETIAAVQSAELDYEIGRLATARARVRMIDARLHRMEGWFDVYASALATSARMFEHDVGLGAALEHLQAYAVSLRRRQLGRVADHLEVQATLMRAYAALNGRADDNPIELPALAGWELLGWREREAVSLARAAALLLQDDAGGALVELQRATDFARACGLRRMELRALLLTSEAADRLGDPDRAQAAFEAALQIGMATGFRRSFIDYGAHGINERLHLIARTGSTAARFALSILGAAEPGRAGGDVRLTRREQEVLQAIEDGGSDKAIARRLDVSEHAVRFHLKNVFHKLKAHSRSEAVQAGRRLGVLNLLDPTVPSSTEAQGALPD